MNHDSGESPRDQTAAITNSSNTEANPTSAQVANASGIEGSVGGRLPSPIGNPIRRMLWLDERVGKARQSVFGPGQPGWSEYDAARHAKDGVVQIGETGQSSWAVLLLERTMASL